MCGWGAVDGKTCRLDTNKKVLSLSPNSINDLHSMAMLNATLRLDVVSEPGSEFSSGAEPGPGRTAGMSLARLRPAGLKPAGLMPLGLSSAGLGLQSC